MRWRLGRRRDERGSALVELTWLGILLIVPVIWIVLSVFEVQRGAFGVSAAARSAGRAFALAPDDATGRSRAEAAARLAMADQGVTGDVRVEITCAPYPHNCHSGTSVVTVVVRTQVTVPFLPDALGGGTPSFRVESSHTVPIGQYVEITGGD